MPYALREALAAFRRAPLLTSLSATMIGLALLVVGLFTLAAYNLRLALSDIEDRVEIVAYLRDDALRTEIALAETELLALPEVEGVTYVSKAQALEVAKVDLPEFEELFTDLEVNPLPASLEIGIAVGSRDSEVLERLARQAASYPFVEDVRFGREWVNRLFFIRRVGAITTTVMGGAFAVVAALIIGTAVRMAIFARREEIYVMRLVGAKDSFIRRPFLLEGGMTGLLGGCLALIMTFGAFATVNEFLFDLSWLPFSWSLIGVGSGALFGLAASGLSIQRHLRAI